MQRSTTLHASLRNKEGAEKLRPVHRTQPSTPGGMFHIISSLFSKLLIVLSFFPSYFQERLVEVRPRSPRRLLPTPELVYNSLLLVSVDT
jgi:hypothetical protein